MTNKISQINIIETSLTMRRMGDLFFGYFDIFDRNNIHHYYYFSIIAEIIIHSRDIVSKVALLGGQIKIDLTETGFKSPNKLIRFFRDAICHNDSQNRINSTGYIHSHNINAALYYPDEITVNTGNSMLHLRRHLFLTYIQALQTFSDYPEFQTNEDFRFVLEIAQSHEVFQSPHQFRNSDS